MITKTIDTSSVKQSVDLRELAARYTELRRASGDKELCGPCPKCGGNDRFHCQAEWFSCRQCHPKRGDAIEFFMWKDGLDFKSAVATLTNSPMPSTTTRRTPAPKRQAAQADDWRHGATLKVDYAHRRLMDDTDKQADEGRRYLDNRGIAPNVWIAFKLGYDSDVSLPGTKGKQKAPAIVMPWYKGNKLRAVRYRFLKKHEYTDADGESTDAKQTALWESDFTGAIYGGHALKGGIERLTTLVICEGEMNGQSIWQTVKDMHVEVLSLGSESATITPKLAEWAAQYARILVWLDREERAQAVMAALPGAYGIKSPPKKNENGQVIVDAKGKPISIDANDMLKSEELGGFLAYHRFLAARDRTEQESMLWDTWDASNVWPGADNSTMEVIAHIAKTLGISL